MPIAMGSGGALGATARVGSRFGAAGTIRAVSSTVGPTPTGNIPVMAAVASNTSAADVPSPVTVLIGLIGLLLILKIVGELDSTAIQPSHVSIGGYNLIAVTVTAIVGIALAKLILTRWNVPGVSALVKFV